MADLEVTSENEEEVIAEDKHEDEFGNDVTEEYKEGDEEASGDDASGEGSEEASEGSEEEVAGDGEEGAGDGEEEVDDVDALKGEIASLRQMARDQRRSMKNLEGQLKKQNAALVDKDIVAEDELSDEESAATNARNDTLEQLVEVMAVNPKYEDVNEVCSQGNTDDVVEMLAEAYVSENGGNADEVADGILAALWAKPNPYKEIYELVKQHHPTYAVEEGAEGKPAKPPKEKPAVAPSLSGLPAGGGKSGTGWTSSRIDGLSEKELEKVPADVYAKYMRDELD